MSTSTQQQTTSSTHGFATGYTSPTVFVFIQKDEQKKVHTSNLTWWGPSIKPDQRELFLKYRDDCRRTSTNLTDDNDMSATLRTMSMDNLVATLQSRLDQVSCGGDVNDFRAIAMDGQDMDESWAKIRDPDTGLDVHGFLLLSVKDPKTVSKTPSTNWLGRPKEDTRVISGCRIYNRRPDGRLRVEADEKLRGLGSRYLEMKRTHEWPSASAATKLLRSEGYKGCEVLTVSEAFLKLPIFDTVRYIPLFPRYSDQAPAGSDSADDAHFTGQSITLDNSAATQIQLIEVDQPPIPVPEDPSDRKATTDWSLLD